MKRPPSVYHTGYPNLGYLYSYLHNYYFCFSFLAFILHVYPQRGHRQIPSLPTFFWMTDASMASVQAYPLVLFYFFPTGIVPAPMSYGKEYGEGF